MKGPRRISAAPAPASRNGASSAAAGAGAPDRLADNGGGAEHDALMALLADLGSNAAGFTVRLERLGDRGVPPQLAGYLGTLPVSAELQEDVAERWGGGRYNGRVYSGNQYHSRVAFSIAGDPKPREWTTQPAAPAAGGEIAAALLEIAKGQAAVLDELRAMRSAPQASGASAVEQVVAVAKALREVAPAPAPAAPTSDAAGATGFVALMRDVLALRDEIAGDERPDNSGGMVAVVREGVTPFVAAIRDLVSLEREKLRSRRPAATATPAGPAGPPNGATSAPPAVPPSPVAALAARIPGLGRSMLAQAARSNADPETYADVVLGQLPADVVSELPALLALPDFPAQLCDSVAEWHPYPGWIAELAECMAERLSGDDAPGDAGDERDEPGAEPEAPT